MKVKGEVKYKASQGFCVCAVCIDDLKSVTK